MRAARSWGRLVDLHCHVLPGVDDGARDDGEALRMLRVAQADGIDVIAATPHAHHCPADLIGPEVERLNELAESAGMTTRAVVGSEARLGIGLVDRYRAGDLLTLNRTPYLLLEVPLSLGWPSFLLRLVDDLRRDGLRPVLAHAERYDAVQRDPAILTDLIALGVVIQINAESLAGRSERGARPSAESLVRRRMAHVIASDAHNAEWRPPRLTPALDRAAELAGDDYALWMVATANAIVESEPVQLPEPIPPDGAAGG